MCGRSAGTIEDRLAAISARLKTLVRRQLCLPPPSTREDRARERARQPSSTQSDPPLSTREDRASEKRTEHTNPFALSREGRGY